MLGYDAMIMAHEIKRYCKEHKCHEGCVFWTRKNERICMLTMNEDVCPEDWNLHESGEDDDS